MGNLIFLLLHFFALVFFIPALIITIPLHLIHSSSRKNHREWKLLRKEIKRLGKAHQRFQSRPDPKPKPKPKQRKVDDDVILLTEVVK